MMSPRPITTIQQAEAFLYDRLNFERRGSDRPDDLGETTGGPESFPFRLGRMRSLAAAAGYDHWLYQPDSPSSAPRPQIVHIAGTKGKGSTATILQSILTAAGHTVGTYTSPHLEHLTGRFRVDSVPVSSDELVRTIDHLQTSVENQPLADELTFFELTTAAAIDLFARRGCDVVILEVGLGGRLDSTNVFDADVAAITSIGLDHQHILGNDHAAIAAEKAGIVKRGRPTYSSASHPDAAAVIRRICTNIAAPLRMIDRDWTIRSTPAADWGSEIVLDNLCTDQQWVAPLAIEGRHQAINASVALMIATEQFGVDRVAVAHGLAAPGPPARLERLVAADRPTILIDTAHNADSIAALAAVLHRRSAGVPVVAVMATSADKDAASMVRLLAPKLTRLIVTQYADNPRAMPADRLRLAIDDRTVCGDHLRIDVIRDASDALRDAIANSPPDGWVVICGSFFLAAQLRPMCLRAAAT